MEVYWYGHVRHCGVSMPWADFDVHCHCGCLFVLCGCAPDNQIGDDGAAALVEGLKVMTNLKELDLQGKCCMVGIVCEASGCDELHGTGCWLVWCAHGDSGQGGQGQ